MSIENLTELLGWCSVINIILLIIMALAIMWLMKPISQMHSRMFNIDNNALPEIYFTYIARYKMLVLIFNIIPYISLKLMV